MRAFVAALYCESNGFSPLPCGWESFRDQMLYRPGEHPDVLHEVTAPLWALRQRARHAGWQVIEGTCAYAKPAAPVQRAVYEGIRDEILDQVRAALPLDMVVLSLHGAMMADGYPDCEGDLVQRVREVIGAGVSLGMLLDPHCHLTQAKLQHCDIVLLLQEAPHTDFAARSEQLLDLLTAHVEGRIKPVASVFDCRMVDIFLTTVEPMRSFVDTMKSLERKPGVLSASLCHGMELGDSCDMGTRTLVYTDGQPELGERLAAELGRRIFDLRGQCFPAWTSLEDAVERASVPSAGTIALTDASDSPGTGAAGDATFMLSALIRRGVRGILAGPLWDPLAVRTAHEAGAGARLSMRIGGKMGPLSGDPLDVEAQVLSLEENAYQTWAGTRLAIGRAALIRFDGVELVINDRRTQAFSADLFGNLGADPTAKAVLALKAFSLSPQSFGAPLRELIYVAGPGAGNPDPRIRNYRNVRRPMWPLDAHPFD